MARLAIAAKLATLDAQRLVTKAAQMFFLTGASGSGKSASLPGLRAALPKIDWRDFDEFGVPSPCPPEWRPLTTERWLQVAVENKQRGKDTGIVGGAIMGEILACPSAPHVGEIHVALLDCHDVVRLDRLRQRGTHGVTQDMLSWAAWQRVHVVDPQWRQDVICCEQLDTMRWERWTNWQRGDPRWHVHVLDSTNLTIDQVVGEIVAWVRASHCSGAHPSTAKPRTILRPARLVDFDYCAHLYFEGMEKVIKDLNFDMSTQIASFRERWDVKQVRIVTLDGTNVGWLQSFMKDDALFLGQLFVNENLRGKGIVTELVKGLIEEAASAGRVVTLGVVKTNPALRLYERLGFRTTHADERKFYMRRDLPALS